LATVRPFCLDVTEVTVAAYAKCVGAGTCDEINVGGAAPSCDANSHESAKRAKHPVNCVAHAQAERYCLAQCKRLPSAEEWEWAARGEDQGNVFPWGIETPDATRGSFVWFPIVVMNHTATVLGTNPEGTSPVGSFRTGDAPGGITDLAGNVAEWTSTRGKDAVQFVTKGGGWDSPDRQVAAEWRDDQSDPASDIGFRCARDTPEDASVCPPLLPRIADASPSPDARD
jgi:formylglycine-generating enzyme required for sulfatase activity